MKHLPIPKHLPIRLAALAAALLIPLGALAADSPQPKAEQKAAQKAGQKVDKDCEVSTASRIHRSKTDCPKDMQPTRSYSKQELESTGQIDTGEALRRLDPRFR